MKLIELTLVGPSQKKILVNFDNVVTIEAFPNSTQILFNFSMPINNGSSVYSVNVTQSPQQIKELAVK